MNKYTLREQVAASFELAAEQAGFYWSKGENKPKYWRGRVDAQGLVDDIFLLYDVTDNLELDAADNKSLRRQIFINGSLYTRQGFSNGDFQDRASALQDKCEEAGFIFNFTGEGVDSSIDQDAPVYYINFEAEKRVAI